MRALQRLSWVRPRRKFTKSVPNAHPHHCSLRIFCAVVAAVGGLLAYEYYRFDSLYSWPLVQISDVSSNLLAQFTGLLCYKIMLDPRLLNRNYLPNRRQKLQGKLPPSPSNGLEVLKENPSLFNKKVVGAVFIYTEFVNCQKFCCARDWP